MMNVPPPWSHQLSLGDWGETEPVGLCAIHEGGVELRSVHAQERGQGDGNVKKLDKWEVPGQSLGHPPFPAVEVVMVLWIDRHTTWKQSRKVRISNNKAASYQHQWTAYITSLLKKYIWQCDAVIEQSTCSWTGVRSSFILYVTHCKLVAVTFWPLSEPLTYIIILWNLHGKSSRDFRLHNFRTKL